jgi:soluble lytic murein transglycosylase-like protein
MNITGQELLQLVQSKAFKYDLDYKLVAAVAWQESRGDLYAIRYEPGFFRRYLEGKDTSQLPGTFPRAIPTPATELRLRAHSFGLMQIMGNTARLIGFDGRYLTELLDPEINLELGARYLQRCWERTPASDSDHLRTKGMLACYNTGRTCHESTTYDEQVLAHLESGAYLRMFER